MEDELAWSEDLRRKLAGRNGAVIKAIGALSPIEFIELRSGILKMAADGTLPGPLKADQLIEFLNSIRG